MFARSFGTKTFIKLKTFAVDGDLKTKTKKKQIKTKINRTRPKKAHIKIYNPIRPDRSVRSRRGRFLQQTPKKSCSNYTRKKDDELKKSQLRMAYSYTHIE